MSSKRSKVHPNYKTKSSVRNWPEYDKAFVRRGDLTMWFAPEALAEWAPPRSGRRGGQQRYSDLAIETTLTLATLFRIPLRQAEVLVGLVLIALDLATEL